MPLCRFRNEKSSEEDFWDKDLCNLVELEGLESSNGSEFSESKLILYPLHLMSKKIQ